MKYNRLVETLVLGCLIAPPVSAQVAKWAVLPQYEKIELLESGLYQISQQGKVGLIDGSGKSILPLEYDSIMPFSEGYAPVIKDGKFVAIVDHNGQIKDVTKGGYELIPGMGGFSSGLMPIQKDGKYFYLAVDGERLVGPFTVALPFFEGKAVTQSISHEGAAALQYDVVNPSFDVIPLSGINPEDVAFMSSFNDGKAVCIAKKKVYTIDGSSMVAVPLTVDPADAKKTTVETLRKEVYAVPDGTSGYAIGAKNGILRFDKAMRLSKIELEGRDAQEFKIASDSDKEYKTNLAVIEEDGLYGLSFRDNVVLPPQFDGVDMLCGNRAVVSRDGEYGVIMIDPDNELVFKLNNNEPIGFNHQFFNSKLSMVMPSYIDCKNARIIDRTNTCDILIDSRKEAQSIEGNSLSYDCRIAIPADATDRLKQYEYKFALKYDGLLSADFPVRIPAWYIKDYNVKVVGTEMVPNTTDRILVDFDLTKATNPGDENAMYYRNVDVIGPDGMFLRVDKKTENRYSFMMGAVNGDVAQFIVNVTEAGCPSVQYPFELYIDRSNPVATVQVLKTDAPDPVDQIAPMPQMPLYGQNQQQQPQMPYGQSSMGYATQQQQVYGQQQAMYGQPQQPMQYSQPMNSYGQQQMPVNQQQQYAQPQVASQPVQVYSQPQNMPQGVPVYGQPQMQSVPMNNGYYQQINGQSQAPVQQQMAQPSAPIAQTSYYR